MKSVAIWMSMFLAVSPLPVQGAWLKEPWGVVWSGETGQTREAGGNGGGEQAAGEYGTGAPGQTQAEAESGAVEAPRAQVQVVSGTGVQAAAPADGPEIHAPSAVLMEASTGQVIYEKNADEQRSPASITKIMTLILIFDAIDSGKIKMSDEVVTSAYAKSMGGSQVFLEGTVIIGLNQKTFMGYWLSPIFYLSYPTTQTRPATQYPSGIPLCLEKRIKKRKENKRRTPMAKIIAVMNEKGGVGKSATATTLAYLLAKRGKRTALIDFDGQGHSSIIMV